MATRQQAYTNNTSSLCENCRQKPKYGNTAYCGKTCASQAPNPLTASTKLNVPTPTPTASLCDYCRTKMKFGGSNFCGKTCAGKASTLVTAAGPPPQPAVVNKSTNATSGLCQFCQQKPRHGTFAFCGKNCAQQAAAMCGYCRAKPRHGTYEFCGKHCAALSAGLPVPGAGRAPLPTSKGIAVGYNGKGALGMAQAQIANPAAIQAQNLQTVHLSSNPSQAPGNQPTAAMAPAAGNNQPTSRTLKSMVQNVIPPLFTKGSKQGQQIAPNPKDDPFATPGATNAFFDDPTRVYYPPMDCRIPGCGLPVFEGDTGNPDDVSEYCSMRCREQAVKIGLESPCIMCLALPQTEVDYFCGRICREEALSKGV